MMTGKFSHKHTRVLKNYGDQDPSFLLWPDADESCFEGISEDLEQFYPQVLNFVPQKRVMIQAGGNCGLYPLAFSKVFASVFTFEPDQDNFHCLSHNCPSDKIVKINAAISAIPGWLRIHKSVPTNVGMHQINVDKPFGPEAVTWGVQVDSLQICDVDFIQYDLEGYELHALRGSAQTIDKYKPVICVEITQRRNEIEDFLSARGYREVLTFKGDHVFVPTVG